MSCSRPNIFASSINAVASAATCASRVGMMSSCGSEIDAVAPDWLRYFFLRGFAFFLVISSRVLAGMASIRRASSSADIGGESSALRFAVMGVSRGS